MAAHLGRYYVTTTLCCRRRDTGLLTRPDRGPSVAVETPVGGDAPRRNRIAGWHPAADLTWKRDGKVMFKETLTPSADGKTLTDVSGAPATTEKVTAVYDRQ